MSPYFRFLSVPSAGLLLFNKLLTIETSLKRNCYNPGTQLQFQYRYILIALYTNLSRLNIAVYNISGTLINQSAGSGRPKPAH
jgi:hypothetical protein